MLNAELDSYLDNEKNSIDDLENIIISFYAKGMSVFDIEEQIMEIYDFDVSTSIISLITNAVAGEVVAVR